MAIFGNMIGGGGDASKYGTTGDYFAGTVIGANTYSIASWAFTKAPNGSSTGVPYGATSTTYGSDANNYVMRRASFPNARVIGPFAFMSCYNLEELYFPNVTTIENDAFRNCSALTTITSEMFPKLETVGIDAFGNCENLKRFEPSAKYISAYAFFYSSTGTGVGATRPALEYINVDFIERIERSTIAWAMLDGSKNCNFLTDGVLSFPRVKEFAVPFTVTSVATYVNAITSFNMPMLKELLPYAFANASSGYDAISFTGIFSCSTLEIIGPYAFANHYSYTESATITGFDLPNVKEVYEQWYNTSLKISALELPELRYVGNYAFSNHTKLNTISLPKYLYRPGHYTPKYSYDTRSTGSRIESGYAAFAGCTYLTEAYMPNCSYIPERFFSGCTQLTSVTLSSTSVYVSNFGFLGCQNLSDINLEALDVIGSSAFVSCAKLPSIMHLENVTYIGKEAFESAAHASGARTLYLSAISYIGYSAFYLTPVKYIYMSGVSSVVELGGNASSVFTASSSLTYIYVPSSLYSDFRADENWSVYSGKFRSV